jgi:hypothetical protein
MRLVRALGPISLVIACSGGGCGSGGASAEAPPSPAVSPVLVELFSSEGCSSCPPAERFLRDIDRKRTPDANVIALEYHVDYWDDLGWKDPFSLPEAGARQRGYASALGGGLFTPELIVQGKHIVRGAARESVADWLTTAASTPSGTIELTHQANHVSLHASHLPALAPGDIADVFIAVSESDLTSRVKSGENSGKTLEHAPVVRSMTRVGAATGSEFRWSGDIALDKRWNPNALRYVVFVQHRSGRAIVAAAQTDNRSAR